MVAAVERRCLSLSIRVEGMAARVGPRQETVPVEGMTVVQPSPVRVLPLCRESAVTVHSKFGT